MISPPVVTVSQVNRRISLIIKNDKALNDIRVKGEISNFVCHYKSGHIYFTLTDNESSLKCVMFSSNASKLKFIPEDGIMATIRGRLDVYERGGQYQLYAEEIEREGEGTQYLEFERLKEKLSAQGLFSQKREIPKKPRSIALITAKGGAALQDMLSVIQRRYPIIQLYLIPVAVQGESAPASIAAGIAKAEETDAEIIIFGRGGGSSEDLSAFNSEIVARAVYDSKIPTISAVGHEIDFTIADFVADLRAPTPSAAAEIAVPDINDMSLLLEGIYNQLRYRIKTLYEKKELQFEKTAQFKDKIKAIYEKKQLQFIRTSELIHTLSPTSIMIKGYSLVYKGNSLIKNAGDLNAGDEIKIKMNGGDIPAIVKE